MLENVKQKGYAQRKGAPEHKKDREAHGEAEKQNGSALNYAARPFFLHAANPLLYRTRPHRGRWYRGKEISEARGGRVRSARGFNGLHPQAGPGVAASLPSASAPAGVVGRIGGKVEVVPGPPLVPFILGVEASIFSIKDNKMMPSSPPVHHNTTPLNPKRITRLNCSKKRGEWEERIRKETNLWCLQGQDARNTLDRPNKTPNEGMQNALKRKGRTGDKLIMCELVHLVKWRKKQSNCRPVQAKKVHRAAGQVQSGQSGPVRAKQGYQLHERATPPGPPERPRD